VGHVLPLLQGRWDVARPSRVQAHALLQRPWIEPEPRGDGGPPGDDRPPERPGCGGVLSGVQEGDRSGGGDPRIVLRWHGPRRRARDFDLPRHRSRRRGDGQGRRRTELPGRRQRQPRMVGRRTPAVHAVVVVVQPNRRAGLPHTGDRGEGQAVPGSSGRGMRRLRPGAAGKAASRTTPAAGRALMPRATLFGRPLPEGGTIGVPATSSPYFNRSEVLRGVEWWESMGYHVKLGRSVWAQDDYVAGTPELRARDVMDLFADPKVDVVQCLQGGFGAVEIIPLIDFGVIAANPKPFCGYSDITALHVAILQRTGLGTFYANGLMGMGWEETPQFNKDRLLRILRGETTGEVPRDPDDPYVRAIAPGKATAPICG